MSLTDTCRSFICLSIFFYYAFKDITRERETDRQAEKERESGGTDMKSQTKPGVRDLPPPCCVLQQDTLLPESTG